MSNKTNLTLLFIIWAIAQIVAFNHFGIVKSVDSYAYIDSAQLISKGELPTGRLILYLSYSTLLFLIQRLGLTIDFIVFVQILISWLGLYSLHQLTYKESGSNLASLTSGVLYILWFKFHQWNFIIYTDSLFTHLCLIFIFYYNKQESYKKLLSALPIIFVCLVRPTGILFVASLILSEIKHLNSERKSLLSLYLSIGILVLLISINQLLSNHVSSFITSYTSGEIIYPNHTLGVSIPKDLYIPKESNQALVQIISFAFHNPIYFGKLFLMKAILFLSNAKPYYTMGHNLYVISLLSTSYVASIFGLIKTRRSTIKTFSLIFISLQIITVSITSENWDGRFLLPVLPWFLIYSGIGGVDVFKKALKLTKNYISQINLQNFTGYL